MCVYVASEVNSLKNVARDVSQGSVLGPVLFLNFVNYIANSVDCCCNAFYD